MPTVPLVRLIALVALAFSLSFSVGILEPAVLGHKILELAGSHRNTALGLITSGGLLVATVTQPFVGVLSDRTRTRLGRRVPFVLIGTAMVIAVLYLIALAPTFGALLVGYLAFQFSANTAQAPWQTVFREHIPAQQRGLASAVRSIFEVLAAVVGRLVAGQVVGLAPTMGNRAIVLAVSIAAVVAVVVTAIVVRAMRASEHRDAPVTDEVRDADAMPDIERLRPGFLWVLANRFLFWTGFMAVTTFLLFFVIDVLGYREADAQRLIGKLSAVIGVVLLASLVPVGRLADRIGRRPLILISGVLAAVGTVCVVLTQNIVFLTLSAGCIGLGVGMYLSASWALVTDFVPERSAARYLGIANTAGASGSAVARLAGGALIDLLNRTDPSHVSGYRTVYFLSAGAFALSTLSAFAIPKAESVTIAPRPSNA